VTRKTPVLNNTARSRFTQLSGTGSAICGGACPSLIHDFNRLSPDNSPLVTGLGHVSSVVDGTRLMAGAITPGIRRLPSVLDPGPIDSSTEPGTGTDVVGASPHYFRQTGFCQKTTADPVCHSRALLDCKSGHSCSARPVLFLGRLAGVGLTAQRHRVYGCHIQHKA